MDPGVVSLVCHARVSEGSLIYVNSQSARHSNLLDCAWSRNADVGKRKRKSVKNSVDSARLWCINRRRCLTPSPSSSAHPPKDSPAQNRPISLTNNSVTKENPNWICILHAVLFVLLRFFTPFDLTHDVFLSRHNWTYYWSKFCKLKIICILQYLVHEKQCIYFICSPFWISYIRTIDLFINLCCTVHWCVDSVEFPTQMKNVVEIFLVACCATLHPALSVGRSVTLYFFYVFVFFDHTAPFQILWWPQIWPLPTRTRLG